MARNKVRRTSSSTWNTKRFFVRFIVLFARGSKKRQMEFEFAKDEYRQMTPLKATSAKEQPQMNLCMFLVTFIVRNAAFRVAMTVTAVRRETTGLQSTVTSEGQSLLAAVFA
uniref:Secreted protein n=1 Tax=Panagrellus redivivus TaxID=6233 RepID=A0A7E4V4M0_PANRE